MNPQVVTGLSLSVGVGVLFTAVGTLLGRAAERGQNLTGIFAISSVTSATAAWVFFAQPGRLAEDGNPRLGELILLFAISGALGLAGQLAFAKAIAHGHKGIAWAVSQAAMVVPVLYAVTLLGDPLRPGGFTGLILILGALSLLAFGRQGTSASARHWILWAFVAFACYGVAQTINMLPSKWSGWQDRGHLRLPLFLSAFAVAAGLTAVVKRVPLTKALVLWALAHSLISLLANFMVFRAMDALAAVGSVSFVYPVAVGVSLLGMVLVSTFLFRERTGPASLFGLLLATGGVVLLALR